MEEIKRLPVFRAIAATFAFFLENWVDLLRIAWLPQLVQMLLARVLASVPGGPLLLLVIGLATNALVAAGILKLVLRGEKPSQPFYLAFGSEELRLIGTWCVIVLLAGAIGGACFIVAFLAGQLFGALPGIGAILGAVMAIAAIMGPLWAMVRLSLASPAAVVGPTIGVTPSWRRTAGQFWPMFGFWLVFVALVFAANWIVYVLLLPDYFSGLAEVMQAPPAERQALAQDFELRLTAMLDLATPAGAGRNAVFFLLGLFCTSLMTLAAGVAWRMTEPENTGGRATSAPETSAGPWG